MTTEFGGIQRKIMLLKYTMHMQPQSNFLFFVCSSSSYNKEEVNNTINEKSTAQNNIQKSSSGFRLFQSSSSNSNQNR